MHLPIPLHLHLRLCPRPSSFITSSSPPLPPYIPHKDMVIVLGHLKLELVSPLLTVGPLLDLSHLIILMKMVHICWTFVRPIILYSPTQIHSSHNLASQWGSITYWAYVIDYVLVSCRFRTSVLDTRVYRSTYLSTKVCDEVSKNYTSHFSER